MVLYGLNIVVCFLSGKVTDISSFRQRIFPKWRWENPYHGIFAVFYGCKVLFFHYLCRSYNSSSGDVLLLLPEKELSQQ